MLSKLHTATVIGIDALPVDVEVDSRGGMPGFHLVGLPMGAVREGGVRVRAALANTGFRAGSARVTVNLAPADVPKEGAALDLPIAVGILVARGQLELSRPPMVLAGELSLDGRIRPIRGALSLAEAARDLGLCGLVVPSANAAEAALVSEVDVYGVDTLGHAVAFLSGKQALEPVVPSQEAETPTPSVDFSEVYGQPEARRAAEVAAAGGHNLMLLGPPGSGKTMVARRMSTILPPMTRAEALETTKVHSVAGLLGERHLALERPFRAPHHTCSGVGLVGGGPNPRPGEVSLAHNGVLFLDELPEFQRAALEALRQPVEDGRVTIVRSRRVVTFPARFMLVAAMNPCPCGYRGSSVRTCTCGDREARRYLNRISGPLLDRFDLFVQVAPVKTGELLAARASEPSADMAARVARARRRQQRRFADHKAVHCNAQMSGRLLQRFVPLSASARTFVKRYADAHNLSGRALHRSCKVARTLADLAGRDDVADEDFYLALTMQQARWI